MPPTARLRLEANVPLTRAGCTHFLRRDWTMSRQTSANGVKRAVTWLSGFEVDPKLRHASMDAKCQEVPLPTNDDQSAGCRTATPSKYLFRALTGRSAWFDGRPVQVHSLVPGRSHPKPPGGRNANTGSAIDRSPRPVAVRGRGAGRQGHARGRLESARDGRRQVDRDAGQRRHVPGRAEFSCRASRGRCSTCGPSPAS